MKPLHRSAATPPRMIGVRRDWLAMAFAAALVLATAASSTASATSDTASGNAEQGSADQGQDSQDGSEGESPWTCDEGEEPRILTPDVTAPSLPFRGVVYADWIWEQDSDARTLVVRYHNTVSRTNTEIVVEGLDVHSQSWIDRTAGGLLITGDLFVADNCTLRHADEDSGSNSQQTWSSRRAEVLIPWGKPARLVAKYDPARESESVANASTTGDTVSEGLGSENFSLGTHANGIHVRVGDQVGAYVMPGYSDSEASANPALYGDFRSWGPNLYPGVVGTDGELLALDFGVLEPAGAPDATVVISMRTGEVVACGLTGWGNFLLLSPTGEGLVVPEIKLPPSGILDVNWGWGRGGDTDCPRDLGEAFFEYLVSQPVPPPASPLAVRSPRPAELPSARAPRWPFGGVVRLFDRYDPQRYVHHRVVQYYDSGSGDVVEIIFDGETGPPVGYPRFTGAGVALGVGRGHSVLIPWGSAPEFVRNEALSIHREQRRLRDLTLRSDGIATDRAALPCVGDRLDEGGRSARATLHAADYGSRWGGWLDLLELEVDNERAMFLLREPLPERSAAISVKTSCPASVYTGEYAEHVPRLLGSDGVVLMVSYTFLEADEFYGGWSTDLTLMFSLETGEILTCGIEPSWSSTLFVSSSEAPSSARLPPSGWLDPYACARGEDDTERADCISIFLYRDSKGQCARELDFGAIGSHEPRLALVPATIMASPSESTQ